MARIQDSKALGRAIRNERKIQKLTQEELAALAGVGVRFLRELEYGKESCRIGLTIQVLKTLGLTVNIQARGELSP